VNNGGQIILSRSVAQRNSIADVKIVGLSDCESYRDNYIQQDISGTSCTTLNRQ
jgi:hypothetical protein